jgi:hypothetical protein
MLGLAHGALFAPAETDASRSVELFLLVKTHSL